MTWEGGPAAAGDRDKEEQQLAWDGYEELRQLQASIDTAIQEECRVSQQLLAAPTTSLQHMPAPPQVLVLPGQPAPPPPGAGPSWMLFVWLVAQLASQQGPWACHGHQGMLLLPSPFLILGLAAASASEECLPSSPEQPVPQPCQYGSHT